MQHEIKPFIFYLYLSLFNLLAPGRPRCHFKTAIFNLVLLIVIFTSSKDNALRWMPRDLNDDKSTLVQVMAWCRQAPSHYPSQCWPSSMLPYDVTRPQWVKAPAYMFHGYFADAFWVFAYVLQKVLEVRHGSFLDALSQFRDGGTHGLRKAVLADTGEVRVL